MHTMTDPSRLPPRKAALLVFVAFCVAHYGAGPLFEWLGASRASLGSPLGWTVLRSLPYVVTSLSISAMIFGPPHALAALGLRSPFVHGAGIGLVSMLPCAILFLAFAQWSPGNNLFTRLVDSALAPGLSEELFYRGMLFGMMFRAARWGFMPAAVVGSVFFGAAHAYQGSTLVESLGIVALTGVGSIWFAWLYLEWNWNLWVPISLHVLLNSCWILFEIGTNALGSGLGNLGRGLAILGSVALTIRRIRKQGGSALKGRWL